MFIRYALNGLERIYKSGIRYAKAGVMLIIVAKEEVQRNNYFNTIHGIALLGLVLRFIYVFLSDYVYYPDEVAQYLEQAHRLVFDYGYLLWEYRFGTRSWLIPILLSGPLWLFKILNLDDPNLYIVAIKLLCAMVSLPLIYATYYVGKNIASDSTGKLAALFVSVWYEVIFFSLRSTPEVFATYFFIGALAYATLEVEKNKPFLLGVCLSLVIIIRSQYFPGAVLLYLYTLKNFPVVSSLKTIGTSGVMFLLAGYLDYLTWGTFFSSYYNNYLFNSVYEISTRFFGKMPAHFYAYHIFLASSGVFLLAIIGILLIQKKFSLPMLCLLVIIGTHSLIEHKEYRFIIVYLPLLMLSISIVISEIDNKIKKNRITLLISIIIIFFSFAGTFNITLFSKFYDHSMYYKHASLVAYKYLYKENGLYSILNIYDKYWFKTGEYYYLHRDIPIYFEEHIRPDAIKSGDINRFVSHIICKKLEEEIPGFKTIFTFNDMDVRAQIHPPAYYDLLPIDTRFVFSKGIDNTYISTVKPWR